MTNPVIDRIVLHGTVKYLVKSTHLHFLGFFHHKTLVVFICKECSACYIPNDAPGHAHKQHSVPLKHFDVEEFKSYCESTQIHFDTRLVPLPQPGGPPVQHIEHVSGVACTADVNNCFFCCTSVTHMQNHIRSHHPELSTQTSSCYVASRVQALFPKFGTRFFRVNPELSHIESHDPIDFILRDYIPTIPAHPVAPASNERQRTVFMR